MSRLIEALERDLLRFRGVRRHESRVVPRVMEVVATFEQRSDTTALSPASPLDADAVIAALDAWILGDWKRLPRADAVAAVQVSRTSRAARTKNVIGIVLPTLLVLGIGVAVYVAFDQDQSATVIGGLASLLVAILLLPLKSRLERHRGNQD